MAFLIKWPVKIRVSFRDELGVVEFGDVEADFEDGRLVLRPHDAPVQARPMVELDGLDIPVEHPRGYGAWLTLEVLE